MRWGFRRAHPMSSLFPLCVQVIRARTFNLTHPAHASAKYIGFASKEGRFCELCIRKTWDSIYAVRIERVRETEIVGTAWV